MITMFMVMKEMQILRGDRNIVFEKWRHDGGNKHDRRSSESIMLIMVGRG
jgi:hypothetical protein